MKRVLVSLMLLTGGAVGALQIEGTFAGFQDDGTAEAYFQADIDERGEADPGHPYEDVDNDGLFTNGTDVALERSDVADGRYHVSHPSHGLVIPKSTGSIEAAEGAIDLRAGDDGHLIVDVKLEADGPVALEAGTDARLDDLVAEAGSRLTVDAGGQIDLEGASLEAQTLRLAGGSIRLLDATLGAAQGIELTAREGPALVASATVEAGRDVRVEADATVNLDGSRIEAVGRVDVQAGADVRVKSISLESGEEAVLTAGSPADAVYVEGARLHDANDTVQAAPAGVDIVGEPAEGSIDYQG